MVDNFAQWSQQQLNQALEVVRNLPRTQNAFTEPSQPLETSTQVIEQILRQREIYKEDWHLGPSSGAALIAQLNMSENGRRALRSLQGYEYVFSHPSFPHPRRYMAAQSQLINIREETVIKLENVSSESGFHQEQHALLETLNFFNETNDANNIPQVLIGQHGFLVVDGDINSISLQNLVFVCIPEESYGKENLLQLRAATRALKDRAQQQTAVVTAIPFDSSLEASFGESTWLQKEAHAASFYLGKTKPRITFIGTEPGLAIALQHGFFNTDHPGANPVSAVALLPTGTSHGLDTKKLLELVPPQIHIDERTQRKEKPSTELANLDLDAVSPTQRTARFWKPRKGRPPTSDGRGSSFLARRFRRPQ